MNKWLTTFLFFISINILLQAQGTILPQGNDGYHIIDRLSIKTGVEPDLHTALRPYLRGDVVRYAMQIDTGQVAISSRDRTDLYYIFKDNNEWLLCADQPTTIVGKKEPVYAEAFQDSTGTTYYTRNTQMEACEKDNRYTETQKPLLKHLYKTPANLFELNKSSFYFRVNPMLDFRLNSQLGDADDGLLFLNKRGLEIRAGIDDRVFIYTNIVEVQGRFANYVNRFRNQFDTHPTAGLLKTYKSKIFDFDNGIDYNYGTAMVGFNVSKHIGVQFGHGNNFIGNGHRSLLLSDFGTNYLHLKLNWKIWKFHYQNIFAEFNAASPNSDFGDFRVPKKYMAAHYLSIKLWKGATFGFYEATVFNRDENESFELQYLNPVILYRSVEQLIGSPDNVIVGANFSWTMWKRFQLYGQVVLDEFKLGQGFGWWANKFGIQAGAKYIDAFGLDHLDLQAEINTVRPYTYTHRDSIGASYSHSNQALAHPLGGNFKELILKARYQPTKKLVFEGRVIRANYGEDEDNDATHWGSNILRRTGTSFVENINDNETGQGIGADITILGLDVSYQIWHNLYFELEYFQRVKDSDLDSRDDTDAYFGAGVRMNIGRNRLDF
jgi:hypothetical protein